MLVVILGVLGVAMALWGCGGALMRRGIFPAPREPRQPPALDGATLIQLDARLDARAGSPAVIAWHVAAPAGSPTLVYFHGNAEQIADAAWLAAAMGRRGLGLYAIEYPGYGLAPGSPSEDAIYAAAERALAHLEGSLGVPRGEVVLVGRSLGSGVAVELARRGHGRALVLLSPYTAIVDVAARFVPAPLARLLVRDRFDSLGKAPSVRVPALVVHGEIDEMIPAQMGRRLGAAMAGARVRIVAGAGHNDLLDLGGPALLDEIAAFAREAGR